jgi:SAM-dependent methyltransferase
MLTPHDLPAVARQYEAFPYPVRDPADERTRLIATWLDDLRMVNHHCFRGGRQFGHDFRVLVAGGGTGDGTIFLAEQLRAVGARVVHLDFSRTAIEVAKARAAVRGLSNVEWVEASLLALPQLGLGQFDLINCVGVLHHLAQPERGLDALLDSLAPGGALVLLLYAQYGRSGVYQMQELLRRLNRDAPDDATRIARARAMLAALPRTNWFRRGEDLHRDHLTGGDSGLYDLLLHPQDRAYTVPQLHEWLVDRCGLHLQFSDWHRGRLPYTIEHYLERADARLLACARALPLREQQAVAELIGGDIITHSFYATRAADTVAPYGDTDYVPFFANEQVNGADFVRLIDAHGNQPFALRHAQSGLLREVDPGRHVKCIFSYLDGARTFGEIFARVRGGAAAPADAELFAQFRPWFDALESIERLLLRRPGCYAGLTGFVSASAE